MKDIIIIGSGKAALLHYNSYKKLDKKGNIYFVDIKNNSKYFKQETIYPTIQDCFKKNNLKKDNVIIDICTPKSEFLNIIEICKQENLNNILVEKPFVVSKETLQNYANLNIVMVENYLYSKVTKWINNYLIENNKEINLIYTNFSKNRMPDSSRGRGYNDDVTLNYEVEIPHQIYLTEYFLKEHKIDNLITCSRDMRIGDIRLENHGYGLIISKCKDIDIIYESNLTSAIVQKRIIITTKDNFSIEGNYAIYTDDLDLVKKANINVYENGILIRTHTIENDDNFTYFIESAYNYFNGFGPNPNLVSILSFSKHMDLYCNNLLSRKKNNLVVINTNEE